jgi:hypothetical protein
VYGLPLQGWGAAVLAAPSGRPPTQLLPFKFFMGGTSGVLPRWFQFLTGDGYSGLLAFTDPEPGAPSGSPDSRPLLLVTDAGHSAVHVIDVVDRAAVGHVVPPGTITHPRGVASRGPLVAVSSSTGTSGGVVHVFQRDSLGSASPRQATVGGGSVSASRTPTWSLLRLIGTSADGAAGTSSVLGSESLLRPYGLRLVGQGVDAQVVVADRGTGSVCMLRVADGAFVGLQASDCCDPRDVELCGDRAGCLVACTTAGTNTTRHSDSVLHVDDTGAVCDLRLPGSHPLLRLSPVALVHAPGLGLVVRDFRMEGRVQVFVGPSTVAQAAMSEERVAWVVAVARALLMTSRAPVCASISLL